MAEAAGLVVGAVGLVGLIGAFKDTIDLFNNFADSRELGRDYEILDTKMDIERTILLQWVDRVNLLRSNCDTRLNDPHTQHIVAQILACIRNLMSDEKELRHRFGVGDPKEQPCVPELERVSTMSGRRLETFIQEFNALNLRANVRNQNTSLRRRVRWIIRDKQKFENLVTQLAYFVTKLDQIVPANGGISMTEEDIGTIRDLRELKTLQAASLGHRDRAYIAEYTRKYIERACQDRILQTLWFRTMNDRQESIAPAHNKTLQWALEPPAGECPWHDLSNWLQYGSGIYWISGKAGSGKSTLMKYLVHHPKTNSLLSQWAQHKNLSTIQFFFFNLGTSLQKSQEGLSRALLYQILSKHRSLIASALPNMWKQLRDTEEIVGLPSATESIRAFQVIAESSSNIGKFCFFIDGLDEFVGDYVDGIAFIQELTANDNVKIVVSSRPIPACVAAFEERPMLQLHHLTQVDIRSYVQDVVGSHKYMQRLINRYPEEAKEIMEDVVTKSSGVFLWVILACRSLISGFSDYDRISELRKRVYELPPELEEMFKHMLSKTNKRNREQGARLLRMCYAANYAEDRNQARTISTLGLALLDECLNVRCIQMLTTEQKRELCEGMEGRLRSRCGGLLELADSLRSCFCGFEGGQSLPHDTKIDSEVVFMHRTVFEFLSNERVWELECLQTPPGLEIPADLSLVRLYSAILTNPLNTHGAVDFFRDGIQWGRESDRNDPMGRRNIFWALQEFFNTPSPPQNCDLFKRLWVMNSHDPRPKHSHAALNLAAEAGAVNYVRTYLELSQKGEPMVHSCDCLPLLYHAVALPLVNGKLKRWLQGNDRLGFLTPQMASLLLSSGNDPNHLVPDDETGSTTPWIVWQEGIQRTVLDDPAKLEVADIAEEFLKFGATVSDDTKDWIIQELQEPCSSHVSKRREKLLQLVTELEKASSASDLNGNQSVISEENSNTKLAPINALDDARLCVGPNSGRQRKRSAEINIDGYAKRTRVQSNNEDRSGSSEHVTKPSN